MGLDGGGVGGEGVRGSRRLYQHGLVGEPRVEEVVSGRFVKVPSWFTAAAALQVARLKGVEHLLVVDRRAVVGSITARDLAAAPPHEPVARRITGGAVSVEIEMPVAEARRLMEASGAACLPVVSGAMLLGIFTAS